MMAVELMRLSDAAEINIPEMTVACDSKNLFFTHPTCTFWVSVALPQGCPLHIVFIPD